MTDVLPDPVPPPAPAPAPRERWVRRSEVRAAGIVVLGLAVLGVGAGLAWWAWSPPRGIALALGANSYIPDETEAFIAADGRFTVIAVVLGLVTGGLTYLWRSVRSPLVALALGVGSVIGALVAAVIGQALGGGVAGGTARTIITPRLQVHAPSLFVVQALFALAVYAVLATTSAHDDLGVFGRHESADEFADSDEHGLLGFGRDDLAEPGGAAPDRT